MSKKLNPLDALRPTESQGFALTALFEMGGEVHARLEGIYSSPEKARNSSKRLRRTFHRIMKMDEFGDITLLSIKVLPIWDRVELGGKNEDN